MMKTDSQYQRHTQRFDRQKGVGLIEVLIALIIISIGTLVSARMQIFGLQSAQDTYYHSQATLVTSSMMDRMRNNPEGVSSGAYVNMDTDDAFDPSCAGSCTPAQQAQQDLFEWSRHFTPTNNNVTPTLPNGPDGSPASGTITIGTDGRYQLQVSWTHVAADHSTAQSVSSKFVP